MDDRREPRRPERADRGAPRGRDGRPGARKHAGRGPRPQGRPARPEGEVREDRRPPAPELPGELEPELLDDVRAQLRGLPTGLAELIAKHLLAAALLVDGDRERALEHARFARSRGARVGAVREMAGVVAYQAGEYAEALSELRTARRLSSGTGLLAMMADCERGLGRPERALELARSPEAAQLEPADAVELRIVAAGARRDLGQLDAAVVELQGPDLDIERRDPWSGRLFYVYADNLAAAGRSQEAVRWFVAAADADEDGDTDAATRAEQLGAE